MSNNPQSPGQFTAEVVRQMIARGACPSIMRSKGIPQSVYRWVIATGANETLTVKTVVDLKLNTFHRIFLFKS